MLRALGALLLLVLATSTCATEEAQEAGPALHTGDAGKKDGDDGGSCTPSCESKMQIQEPADPDTWADNFLCFSGQNPTTWSYAEPLAGRTCLNVTEPAEPAAQGWSDNYLCF